MAGGETLYDEILELEALVAQVKTAGNKRDLQQLLRTKQTQWKQQSPPEQQDEPMHEASEDATLELPKPAPVKVGTHAPKPADIGEDINVYTEISRFGWEDEGYGKDKVTVHIMSGVDGVGELPKDNVTCAFTKDSFDLKILGLHGKNYRLVKNNLDKPINVSKSTYRVKKNRVSVTLWKEDNKNTWMNLTAKNPNKQNRDKKSSDPTAGIMDMMKDMYEDGDEDMKRTIAKAWSESREKQQKGGDMF